MSKPQTPLSALADAAPAEDDAQAALPGLGGAEETG
jgi:hypothetical protein